MAQPNTKDLIVEGPLRNVSIQYRNQAYIADQVFPIIDKIDPKAKIARYLKGAWFRDEAQIRGPGSRAVRGGYPVDFISIATDEYAFAKEVTDEDRRFARSQMAPPLSPDQDALEFCADKIDLKKEILVASMISSGTWSGVAGEDAAGLWSPNDGTNTFVNDVLTRIETIRSNTGRMPNRMIIDHATYNKLKENTAILDRVRYTQQGVLTSALLAAMFDLEAIYIATAIKNTALETKAGTEFTTANVWEKNAGKGSAFLYYAPPRPGLRTPSAGYQARPAYEDGQPRRVVRWREAAEHQDVYEVAEETDIVQTGADLGFFWYDTHTT
jgi:hypothetical protein